MAYAEAFDEVGYADTTTVHMPVNEIKKALKFSSEYFINFFIGDKIEYPVPEFHSDVFATMTSMEILRFACAIPRDHAKTTLAKLSVIWHFLFSRCRFCVYVSCTLSNSINAVNDIVEFLRADNFVSVFGKPRFFVEQDGKGYYKFKLFLEQDGKIVEKICILRAFSTNQKIRGLNIDNKRPDLAVLDDIEDEEIVENETTFQRAKRWLYGPFKKALDKFWHKIIHLGNMVANICMLREHIESKFWHAMHYGCLRSDGTPLWSDAWPLDKLREDFQEYAENGMTTTWFVEMMNMPLAGRGPIKEEEIQFADPILVGTGEFGFITVDPAISEENWACKTAVVAHVWNGEQFQSAEYYTDVGVDPIQMFDIVLSLAMRWNIRYVGIENAAYQASIKHVFAYLAILNGVEADLEFVPLYADKKKSARITTWAGLIKKREYVINKNDFYLVNQLLEYDPTKKNNTCDLIDACAYSVQMIDLYLPDIMDAVRNEVVEAKAVPVSEMQGAL